VNNSCVLILRISDGASSWALR